MKPLSRTTIRCLFAVAAVALGCTPDPDYGTYTAALDGVSGDAWAADVRQLLKDLEARHPDPYHSADRTAFRAEVEALASSAAGRPASTALADELLAGVAVLLARLQEGHTTLNAGPDLLYPLAVRRFPADGGTVVHLTSVAADGASVNGARVTRIGPLPTEEAVAVLRRASSAELEEGRDFFALERLSDPRLMRGLGLADGGGLSLTTTAGPVTLQPMPADTALSPIRAGGERAALTFRRSERWWFEQVGRVVYLQYNQCSSQAQPVLDRVAALVEGGGVDRLVWDLRFNGGGNSAPGTDFARRIGRTALGRNAGGVIVLIGRRTFSSAIMNAVDAVELAGARLAGEPLSTPVNGWGEVRRFALENTGLVIGHSTRFWDYTRGKSGLRLTEDGRLQPDERLSAQWSFEEWRAGQDPALEAALAYRP